MKNLLGKLKSAISWRYHLYIEPYRDLHGGVISFLRYKLALNLKFRHSKILYIYANKRNVGDYISHRGIQFLIGHAGLELYCSKVWMSQLKKYLLLAKKDNKIVVVGGGGLFQPAFRDFWSELLASQLRFYCIGVGINYMERRPLLDSTLMRDVVIKSESCLVRDVFTFEKFKALTRDSCSEKLMLTACPSINFIQKLRSDDALYNTHSKESLVHVCHPSDLRLAGANSQLIRQNVQKYAAAKSMIYVETDNMSSNAINAMSLINSASLVVSSRLHGCIMAFASEKHFVPLVCDNKTREFVQTHTGTSWIGASSFEDYDTVVATCEAALAANLKDQKERLVNTVKETADKVAVVERSLRAAIQEAN